MNHTVQNLTYYKARTVQISHKKSGALPKEQNLSLFLLGFGTILDLQLLRIKYGTRIDGKPNTAIVVFTSASAAKKIIQSSLHEQDGSFWQISSIKAHKLQIVKPIMQVFSKKVVPRLTKFKGMPPSPQPPPRSTRIQSEDSIIGDCGPPAKRHKAKSWVGTSEDIAATGENTPRSKAPDTPSPAPESYEWMCARITQLEAELDSTRAARDMAISDHDIIRLAHQAERNARREAMTEKSSAERALSRKETEQDRLRSALEAALSQKSALLDNNDTLRRQLTEAEESLKMAQLRPEELGCRVVALKMELEEARDQIQKLQLQKALLEEQQKDKSDTTALDDAKARMDKFTSRFKQLESDLVSTQMQLRNTQTSLESTRMSLESMEEKFSSAHKKYQKAKEKTRAYKERLQNEKFTQGLKEALTPKAQRSLGVTHEIVGKLLTAAGHLHQ
ncbi:unnamed protein product [Rhizoctonia solani]|uniref:Uncharacterized protein n=1 Tax=Rhizoctonia solani TaxID=456999 RepID=A0A8H3C2R2_9AGAM|nr:unnamed protein product [Rhizoctonia solani]